MISVGPSVAVTAGVAADLVGAATGADTWRMRAIAFALVAGLTALPTVAAAWARGLGLMPSDSMTNYAFASTSGDSGLL